MLLVDENEREGDAVAVAVADDDGENDATCVPDGVSVGDRETTCDAVALALAVCVRVWLPLAVEDALGNRLPVGVVDRDAVAAAVPLADAEKRRDGDGDGVTLGGGSANDSPSTYNA